MWRSGAKTGVTPRARQSRGTVPTTSVRPWDPRKRVSLSNCAKPGRPKAVQCSTRAARVARDAIEVPVQAPRQSTVHGDPGQGLEVGATPEAEARHDVER